MKEFPTKRWKKTTARQTKNFSHSSNDNDLVLSQKSANWYPSFISNCCPYYSRRLTPQVWKYDARRSCLKQIVSTVWVARKNSFVKCHSNMVDHTFSKMKFRQQLCSTAINIIFVKIAQMIYLTRHLLTKIKVHQQVNWVRVRVRGLGLGLEEYISKREYIKCSVSHRTNRLYIRETDGIV